MAVIDEIEATLERRDFEAAEKLIFRAAMDFIAGQPARRLEPEKLEAWVEALSADAPNRAWIAFYQAWVAHSTGQPTLAYMLMQRAARYVEATEVVADADEKRRWRSIVHLALAMTALSAGQPADIGGAFAVAREGWLQADRGHPTVVTPEEAARWTAVDPIGLMKFWLEIAAITEALSEFEALAASLNNLSLFVLDRGEPVAARRLATQSCELRRTRGPRLSLATSLNTLGMAERVAGELVAAHDDLLEARRIARRNHNTQTAAYALSNFAEVAADSGDDAMAWQAFDRSSSEKEAMADAFGLAWGWRAWARARRLSGDAAGALELATRAFELRQASFDPNERTLLLVELGACLIAAGSPEEGLARLAQAEQFVDLFDLKATKAALLVQRHIASGDPDALAQARRIADQFGLRCLDREWPSSDDADNVAPVITAQLIGEFRLRVGSTDIDPGTWKSRRAAEVLRILALHGGRPVHADKLLDWVWPDEGPAAKPSLNAALTAIRRSLEAHGATRDQLSRDGERYALTPFGTSDVSEFDVLVTRARTAEGTGRTELAIALLLQALERWRNEELLPADRYAAWAEQERERVSQLVADVREHVAEMLLAQNELEDALAMTLDLLVQAPTRETAHRLLIRTHLARSDAAAARRAFDDCASILDSELGVTPSDATRALLDP